MALGLTTRSMEWLTGSLGRAWAAALVPLLLHLSDGAIGAREGGWTPGASRPNILFILSDDQRWDTLGAYGNQDIRTPAIDRLAREGALFTEAYVAAPLCCPSRGTFLMGLYPHQTGILTNGVGKTTIPAGVKTVAHYLTDAGYVTGFVGKAHLDGGPFAWGFREAPVYLPGGGSRHANPVLMVGGSPRRLPGEIRLNGEEEEEVHSREGEEVRVEGLITPIFADAAIAFLKEHREERFFLWLATTAPHRPYYDDPSFPYRPERITPPPGWHARALSDTGWAGYYSTISHLDFHLGRVLRELEELGLKESTVVIYASDNGLMMGSHGIPGKAVWYEESIRVPWLVAWKGKVAPGTIVRTPVESVDFLPTVLDLAGIPIPATYEGLSFLPALGVSSGPMREVIYSEVKHGAAWKELGYPPEGSGGHWQMVKSGQYKYVRTGEGREVLYDLQEDPAETQNRAADRLYEGVLLRLRALHAAWLERTPPSG